MKQRNKQSLCVIMILILIFINGISILAQEGPVETEKPYLALGADLTQEQKTTVLGLLEIDPNALSNYTVVEVTNEEEYEYLGSYLAANVIGSKSLSSVSVIKKEVGHGILVTTKNISYCTTGMYRNALITAGITDADIVVAGPISLSGTAALVGAIKAYSVMTGEEVSSASMDAALNELVITGELGEEVGNTQKVEELVGYLKQVVVEDGLESEADIRVAVEQGSKELGITLTEDDIQKLLSLLTKISTLDLDLDSIKNQAKDLYEKLEGLDIDTSGVVENIINFFAGLWESIKNFISGLLG